MVLSIILNICLGIVLFAVIIITSESNEKKQKELESTLIHLKNKAYEVKTFKQLYLVTREFTKVLSEPKTTKNVALYNELKAYLDMRHNDMMKVKNVEENIEQDFTIAN